MSQVHVDTGLSESSQTKEHKGNTKDEVANDFAFLAIDKDDGEEESRPYKVGDELNEKPALMNPGG